MKLATFFGISLLSFALNSFASPQNAQKHYDEAVSNYSMRDDLAKVDLAIANLAKAESLVGDDVDLKFQILMLSTRAPYWRALNTEDRDKRLELYQAAIVQAQKMKDLNKDLAEGHYYHGIALARWAETKGGTESLAKKNEIMALINEALARETYDGLIGQELDGYGPDRTLGRMYYRLPSFAGGSIEKSHKHLKAATSGGGATALNFVYFAETLIDMGGNSKTEGCKILANLLSNSPETYNADRIPETKREMALGQALKNSSCKK